MRRYYEFAIVVTLIGALALLLLGALDSVRDDMEEAIVQSEAANLRLGLVEVLTHRAAFGGNLPQSNNPVDWVASKPTNYLGEFDTVPDARSAWYFDRQTGELVYCFHSGNRARFRLGRGGKDVDGRIVISGISLQRLDKRHE
ncbi:hypothetical protein LZ012_07110 [Dechloromonas sp. XY25]|uniref:Type II secretion system protein GspG C-terminal domain-containing protein n=1 Tax=Dechloromonas hankyongensis TaxID=2908002 RepID=A0ABS9K0S3_9RHOO|nr:hypothetical protein [Dechloromonas hankyongensis]MCG2576761.1 hypothetical protein [Dechloromonas hankyongensis]